MLRKFKYLISATSLFLMFYFLILSKKLSQAVAEGIIVCTNVLIPSMFIFLIISEFFYKTRVLNYILKPFSFISEKLFKIDKNLGPILFFSLICGYPAGSNLITKLVLEKKISKETANRMLHFCVNAGPSFLISGVSIPLSNSIQSGLVLFISQIVAFFFVGFLTSIGKKTEKIPNITQKEYTISESLVSSVINSIKTMAIICGFSLFFCAIIKFLFNLSILININSNPYLKPLLAGFLEITNGIMECGKINNLEMFIIISFITSFGGLSVHCQILSIISKAKISFKNFYFWRIIYCLISNSTAIFLFMKFKIVDATFPQSEETHKIVIHNPIISISLIILSIALLCCEKKIIIIKNNLKKLNQ